MVTCLQPWECVSFSFYCNKRMDVKDMDQITSWEMIPRSKVKKIEQWDQEGGLFKTSLCFLGLFCEQWELDPENL